MDIKSQNSLIVYFVLHTCCWKVRAGGQVPMVPTVLEKLSGPSPMKNS